MVCLFVVRGVVAIGRRHGLDRWFDNRPILVMVGAEILDKELRHAKIPSGTFSKRCASRA